MIFPDQCRSLYRAGAIEILPVSFRKSSDPLLLPDVLDPFKPLSRIGGALDSLAVGIGQLLEPVRVPFQHPEELRLARGRLLVQILIQPA